MKNDFAIADRNVTLTVENWHFQFPVKINWDQDQE